MRKVFLILAVLFTLLSMNVFASTYIQRIYPTEIENAKHHQFLIILYNENPYKLNDATISVYFPDFYINGKSSQFDLKTKKAGRIYLETDFPEDVKPGYYPVILTLQNEDIREKKHTWIQIV